MSRSHVTELRCLLLELILLRVVKKKKKIGTIVLHTNLIISRRKLLYELIYLESKNMELLYVSEKFMSSQKKAQSICFFALQHILF